MEVARKYAGESNNDQREFDLPVKSDDFGLNDQFLGYALGKHAIVSVADVKGKITYVNDKFTEISGYSEQELIGQNHRIVKSDEHSKEFYRDMWRTIANGGTWSGEVRNLKKNGEPYWVKATIIPFLNKHGKPEKYLSIRTDITEVKAAEAMRERGASFDLVRKEIYLFSLTSLRIFYANRQAYKRAEIFGLDPIGLTPMDLSVSLSETEFRQWISPLLDNRQEIVSIIRDQPRIDGGTYPAEISIQLVRPEHEAPRFFASIRDISARKQAERAKMDFLSVVNHELRTPLTAINGYAQFLANPKILPSIKESYEALSEPTQENAAQKERLDHISAELSGFAKRIRQSSERLTALINDTLDFAKIDAGSMQIETQETAVFPAACSVVDNFEQAARDKGVGIFLRASAHKVIADETRLRQILSCLVSNAIKFTEIGSITIKVSTQDAFVKVEVIDTGCGVATSALEKIFDTFNQGDNSATREVGGTGLGLAIAKRLVELQGGEIGAHSVEGMGSTFWFTLPSGEG